MREKTPKVMLSRTGTPARDCTWAEIRMRWKIITPPKRYPVRGRYDGRGGVSNKASSFQLPASSYLVDRNLPEQVEVRQHLAGAEHDGRQRIFRHRERQPGLFAQAFV